MTLEKTYTLAQIKNAFWEEFHETGKRWFGGNEESENSEKLTSCSWDSFLDVLDNVAERAVPAVPIFRPAHTDEILYGLIPMLKLVSEAKPIEKDTNEMLYGITALPKLSYRLCAECDSEITADGYCMMQHWCGIDS